MLGFDLHPDSHAVAALDKDDTEVPSGGKLWLYVK